MAMIAFTRLGPRAPAIAIARISGEREKHLGEAHERFVDETAGVPGDEADGRADHACERDNDDADDERDTRAIQDAAEEIAAELVRPEPMRCVRRCETRGEVLRERVIRRDERRED